LQAFLAFAVHPCYMPFKKLAADRRRWTLIYRASTLLVNTKFPFFLKFSNFFLLFYTKDHRVKPDNDI
ncbi:hypothetical protein, partial [uncultured Treponema sp.]|uniref:hypothetical protein n=1 Tax=uncultured Treponema sp. TaxID=162155 RepID=UPI00280B9820